MDPKNYGSNSSSKNNHDAADVFPQVHVCNWGYNMTLKHALYQIFLMFYYNRISL